MKLVALLLLALVGVIGAYFFYSQGNSDPDISSIPTDNIELEPQKESEVASFERDAALSEPEVTTFSEDANYPTPVIELQQTLTHGIQNLDAPELPLVQGDLKDFSEQNMPQDIAPPEELIELNQELERLQTIVDGNQN
ncbi:hypothetical protein [Vibrio penaeicida]|uniref:hypothetical protein n=1 Tax=Vibrio penaeicida TaxID=104609 RepID=UPI000CEA467A|nr:hypothetical protein [Vibrio penaeicida]